MRKHDLKKKRKKEGLDRPPKLQRKLLKKRKQHEWKVHSKEERGLAAEFKGNEKKREKFIKK